MNERTAPRPPLVEPEIIPPGAAPRHAARIWISTQTGQQKRVYIARPGPVASLLLLGVAVGGLAVFAFLLLLGAVLLWLPLIGLVAGAALLSGLLGGRSSRRLR